MQDVESLVARLDQGEVVAADEVTWLNLDMFVTGRLGLVWDTFSRDRVAAHLDIGPEHHQVHGIVHGGVWCAVVESLASVAGALAVRPVGWAVVGVSNSTDFIRAHRDGRVDAVAEPLHLGRTQQLWQVVISRAADGKTLARGQVRLQNLDPSTLPA